MDAKRRSENLARYIATKNAEFERMKKHIRRHISYGKSLLRSGQPESNVMRSDYYKKRKLPRSLRQKILAAGIVDEISKLKRERGLLLLL